MYIVYFKYIIFTIKELSSQEFQGIVMLLSGIHLVLWMLMPGLIAVFAGIPFMLMVAKVQKLGAVFLMELITALIYFSTGQFTLVILIINIDSDSEITFVLENAGVEPKEIKE